MNPTLGRYSLLRRIGAGGMAEVWKARVDGPAGFMKSVAIKRVLPDFVADDDFIEMFVEEAKLVAQLVHPNIVQVFDFGEAPGSEGREEYYIAMEYVAGQNLASVLRRLFKEGRALSPELALFIGLETAKALAYAHAATSERGMRLDIVHRDVSPHNILVSYRGEVKVTDFGIAKVATALGRTATGVFKGKLAYMSPEQARLESLDGRSDVFSLGIVLFEAISGKRLFADKSGEQILAKVLQFEPPSAEALAAFPPAVREPLRQALQVDREKRLDARRLETALAEALGGAGMSIAREGLAELMTSLFAGEIRAETEVDERASDERGGTAVSAAPESNRAGDLGPSTSISPAGDGTRGGPGRSPVQREARDQSVLRRALDLFGSGWSARAGAQATQPTEMRPHAQRTSVSPAPRGNRLQRPLILGGVGVAIALGLVMGRVLGGNRAVPAQTATPAALASAAASAAMAAPSPSPPADVEVRLEALRHLHDDGLITDDEYEKRRNTILEKF